MCGIAAFFAYHYAAPGVDREDLGAVSEAMARRGPDGRGEWVSGDGRAALAHRRLSIIDLSESGAQPMASADGSLVVSFNGEIYNWRAIRARLEASGRRFRTQSDTEVLLHLYEENGDAMVGELRGMFAFALWDGRRRRLLLARDPYGIKPLYYADDGWTLRAASQVKALLRSRSVSKATEPAGDAGFLLLGSVPEPFTPFREIRQVPAGATVAVESCGPSEPSRYFSVAGVLAESERRPADAEAAAEAVRDSLRHHFVADVPVGVFLSAGIDSSTLAVLAVEQGMKAEALTLGFEEFVGTPLDEAPEASRTAAALGLKHRVRMVARAEFEAEIGRFFGAMDQPSIDGLNVYFVSKAAAESGWKAALTGLGADELWGGYPSFSDVPRWGAVPARPRFLGRAAQAAGLSPKAAGLLGMPGGYAGAYWLRRGLFMPWELEALMGRAAARQGLERLGLEARLRASLVDGPASPHGRVAALESCWYMRNQLFRDADWAGMAHSLEIRTPFADAALLKAAGPHAMRLGRSGKAWLAAMPRTPRAVGTRPRPKTGFTVPLAGWLEKGSAQEWRKKPLLASGRCHWSRRWAYSVLGRWKEAA